MTGRVRLGCVNCGRDDFDGIHKIPDDWEDVDEVQSYEESIQEADPEDDGDVMLFRFNV